MKSYVTLLPGFLLCLTAGAQITVTHSHITGANQQVIYGRDQNEFRLPAPGANQVWDFRSLDDSDHKDTLRYGQPNNAPGHSNFPGATLTQVYVPSPNSINYILVSDSLVKYLGSYNTEDSSINDDAYAVLYLPATYNASRTSKVEESTDVYTIKADPDGAGPLPFIDSLEVKTYAVNSQVVDGWGILKLPAGDFQVLKYTMADFNQPVARIFANSSWLNAPDTIYEIFSNKIGNIDTSFAVDFWTNDANIGVPLMSYSYDAGDTSSSEFEFLVSHSLYSGISTLHINTSFAYPNPAGQVIKINTRLTNPTVLVYNLEGQLVVIQDLHNTDEIDVSRLARGVYTVKLLDNAGGTITGIQKIILANP